MTNKNLQKFNEEEEDKFPVCVKNLNTHDEFKPAQLTAITLLKQDVEHNSQDPQANSLRFVTSSSLRIRNMDSIALLMPLCIRVKLLLDGNKGAEFLGPIEVHHQKDPLQDMLIYVHRLKKRVLVFCLQYKRLKSTKISVYAVDPLFQETVKQYVSETLINALKDSFSLCIGLKREIDKFLYLQEQKRQIGSSCFNLGTVSQLHSDYEESVLACLNLISQNKPITKKKVSQTLRDRHIRIKESLLEEILNNLCLMGYLEKVEIKNLEKCTTETVFQLK
ncbi:MAG: hypothetical protein ACFFC7_29600 [Candidatus Hermodarchaeota archaeon]